MDILSLLKKTIEKKASDLHISVTVPPVVRVNGELQKLEYPPLTPEDTMELVQQILTDEQFKRLNEVGELDLSYSNEGVGRYRVNVYKQRGCYSAAIRSVSVHVPSLEQLNMPSILTELAMKQRGLILVTGPTGSGKSTTLAAMIDYMNKNRNAHILTLEDPIEYLHKNNLSIINQREIGNDSHSFSNALRGALRQDPDVILVGEMRDLDTVSIAVKAAETGHLVISSLHTTGAAKTIDRVIDVFPPEQQQQIKIQLSGVLEGIVSQQLISCIDGQSRVAALEIMIATPAIRNLIREGKNHQIGSAIQTGMKFGMKSMDQSLNELYRQGKISKKSAAKYAIDREAMERVLGL